MVNLIPPGMEIIDFKEVLAEFEKEKTEDSEDKVWILAKALYRHLEEFPEEFRAYVRQEGEWREYLDSDEASIVAFEVALRRYLAFMLARPGLKTLINLAAESPANRNAFLLTHKIESESVIAIDDEGIIRVVSDEFLDAIDGVDITRIRKCEICDRFFWAGRITQQACSTACAHALRNRRYRARYKDYLIRQHLKESATDQEASSSSRKSNSKKKK